MSSSPRSQVYFGHELTLAEKRHGGVRLALRAGAGRYVRSKEFRKARTFGEWSYVYRSCMRRNIWRSRWNGMKDEA